MATTQEALQIGDFVPILTVDDLQKSIKFYEASASSSTSGEQVNSSRQGCSDD